MAKKVKSKSNGNGKNHLQSFSLHSPAANKVLLAGDFTQWEVNPIPMQKDPDGIWKANVELSPGVYHYRFTVDGEWRDDPECAQREPNPFGTENMMRRVA